MTLRNTQYEQYMLYTRIFYNFTGDLLVGRVGTEFNTKFAVES